MSSMAMIGEARRFLRSAPTPTLAGVLVLGLGLGSSAVALSLLSAATSLSSPGMRSLGYATIAEETAGGGSVPLSFRRVEQLRLRQGRLAAFAGYGPAFAVRLGPQGGSAATAAAVSSGFFSVFTQSLLAGRDFTPSEEQRPDARSVILGAATAQAQLGSAVDAVGRDVTIGGAPYQVVGVAPLQFNGVLEERADLWVPAHSILPLKIDVPAKQMPRPDIWKDLPGFYAFAGSTRLGASSLAASLGPELRQHDPSEAGLHASQGLTADPVRDVATRRWLRLGLLLAVLFTLVMCLNVSLLLLARSARSAADTRLKQALGASRRRLLTDLLAGPAAMLALSSVLATVVWAAGLKTIAAMPGFYGELVRASWKPGLEALAVQMPLACLMIVPMALLPALRLLRDDGATGTGPGALSGSTATRRSGLLIQLPVVLQLTCCGCLWILSGMVVSASLQVLHAPLGYRPDTLTAVMLTPSAHSITFTSNGNNSFPSAAAMKAILDRVKSLPGVHHAAFSSDAPFEATGSTLTIRAAGVPGAAAHTAIEVRVSPDYFNTMGEMLLRGQGVAWHGVMSTLNEVVLNRTLARELFADQNPLGRDLDIVYPAFAGRGSFGYPGRVVGVVEDVRSEGPAAPPLPSFFSSMSAPGFTVTPVVLVDGPIAAGTLRRTMDDVLVEQVPELAVDSVVNISEKMNAVLQPERQRCRFAVGGALLMGCLAYLGLYGSLVHYVSVRRKELAVRLCLGATQTTIRMMVVQRAFAASACAALCSVPLWPLFAHLSAGDYLGRASWSTPRAILLSFGCVALALLAALLPANVAAHVSPAEMLKES